MRWVGGPVDASRANEDLCCAAMVLNALHPDAQRNGLLLLHIVEFLSSPEIRPRHAQSMVSVAVKGDFE